MARKTEPKGAAEGACRYAESLSASLDFMAGELARLESALEGTPATVEYTDSQGRRREKQNPIRAEYRDLFKTFCTGVTTLERAVDGDAAQAVKPKLDRFKVIKGARAVGDD